MNFQNLEMKYKNRRKRLEDLGNRRRKLKNKIRKIRKENIGKLFQNLQIYCICSKLKREFQKWN